MKIITLIGAIGITMLLAGCASLHRSSYSNCEPTNGQSASYDPTNDVTTISNQGYTWYLKGNHTNVMLYPKH